MVFLPYKASMWDSLESVWRAAYEDKDNCLAYVIPIPYCDRNPDGTAKEWHCERDLFPKDVLTLDWQEVDLKTMHPDVIFFHYPYDNCNKVTSPDEAFYSRNLKECADKLVYIPYFVLGEPKFDYDDPEKAEEVKEAEDELGNYILEPGVFNADLTIVQSEAMKKVYVNVLERHTNAPEGYWEEHILGLGSPKFDKVAESRKEDFQLPEEWERLIRGRKTVLYNTGLTAMLKHTDKFLEKIRSVLETFKAQEDVVLWWRPHPLLRSTFESMHPELLEEYDEIVSAYRRENWGIYDDTAELERAVAWTDGYYGDTSSVVQLYEKTGKPIMIENLKTSMFPRMTISFSAISMVGRDLVYFVDSGLPDYICCVNIKTEQFEILQELPFESEQEQAYAAIGILEDKAVIAPRFSNRCFLSYNLRTKQIDELPCPEDVYKMRGDPIYAAFLFSVKYENRLYFIGCANGYIVECDASNNLLFHKQWSEDIKSRLQCNELVVNREGCILVDGSLFLVFEGLNYIVQVSLHDFSVTDLQSKCNST